MKVITICRSVITKNQTNLSRRELLGSAAAVAAFTIVPRHVMAGSGAAAPSDKLNLGKIGCGGMQGGGDLAGCKQRKHLCTLRCGSKDRRFWVFKIPQ